MRALAAVSLHELPEVAVARGPAPDRARASASLEAAAPLLRVDGRVQRALLVGTVSTVAAIGAWAAAAGIDGGRLVILLALAPLLEETAFRAGLHEALLRRASLARHANLLTALAFGLAHALVQGHALAVAVALPAWFVGLAYERWRRVRDCVALHALLNALWIAWVVAAPTVG